MSTIDDFLRDEVDRMGFPVAPETIEVARAVQTSLRAFFMYLNHYSPGWTAGVFGLMPDTWDSIRAEESGEPVPRDAPRYIRVLIDKGSTGARIEMRIQVRGPVAAEDTVQYLSEDEEGEDDA